MGRPKQVDSGVKLHTSLPTSIHSRLHLSLFSEAEGRVPHGAVQKLLVQLINQHFTDTTLDLQAYGLPAGYVVRGHPSVINALKGVLDGR